MLKDDMNGQELRVAMAVVKNRLESIDSALGSISASIQTLATTQSQFVTSVETRLAVGSERFATIVKRIDEGAALLARKADADDLDDLKGQLISKRTVGGISGGVAAGIAFLFELVRSIAGAGPDR
ncbi:MAG: hypothetical protein ACRD1K_20680 [Acidimicrobiales bacterium]